MATRPDWFPEKQFPVASRFVDAAYCRVHYVDEGQGAPLLLLHGNPTWSFLYRHIIRELAPKFRCVAPDFPGFGLSRAPQDYDFLPVTQARVLGEFIRRLDLKDVVMMVQDWSGPIGLWAAAQEPWRFRGLVIGNTWAWSGKGDRHFERFSRLMGGRIADLLNRRFNFFPRLVIPRGMRIRKPSPEVMQAYLAPFSESGTSIPLRVFPREITGSSEFLQALESKIGVLASLPALIVWGDRDFAFREKERLRFEALFPSHRTLVLRGAGHFIQEDAPEEIAAAISANWPGNPSAVSPRRPDTLQ